VTSPAPRAPCAPGTPGAPGAGDDAPLDVCAAGELVDGGDGVRFAWTDARGATHAAFVVRQGGAVHAFVNCCPHRFAELDWLPGRFFDDAGLYLVCSMHGALFDVASGACVAGPCAGDTLQRLACEERDGRVRVARACVPPGNPLPGKLS